MTLHAGRWHCLAYMIGKSMTKVTNLGDGREVFYTLRPVDAVRAAWLAFTRRDKNTWDYDKHEVPVVYGRVTVCAGDWCALLRWNPS
jgi:hypothetical protein